MINVSIILSQIKIIMGGFHTVCDNTDETGQQIEENSKIEYDGQRFRMPKKISFDKQSTFAEVEHAARAFCHKNGISAQYVPVLTRIIAYRHQKIFQNIWSYLREQDRQDFFQDLNSIQHDLMDSLYHHFILCKSNHFRLNRSTFFSPALTIDNEDKNNDWSNIATKLIQQNKVAVVFMCAGSSLRFGEDKFLFPFGSKQISIFDLMFMRLRRNTKAINIPIIISCSAANIERIHNYLISKQYYGFESIKVRCFESKSLAIFNNRKSYCIDDKLHFIKRSAGTAYSALHLLNTNKINNFLNFQGAEYVYFSGMENIMENPCDPIFLGMVADQKRQMGAKCVDANFCQKFPRYYRTDKTSSKVQFLNESHLQSVSKEARKLPIGINSMIFSMEFLKSILSDFSKYMFLAQHYDIIEKQEIVYNPIRKISESFQCLSFEKDIRFLVSCCQNPLIYKVDRSKQYAPILSKNNEYSLEAAYKNYANIIEEDIEKFSQSFG